MAKKDQLEELSSDELKSILDEESENIDPSSKTDDKDKAEEQPKKKSKRLVEIDNPYEKFKNYKDPVASRYRKKMFVNFFLSLSVVILCIIITIAYLSSLVGNLTVQLERDQLALTMSEDGYFESKTTRLRAESSRSTYAMAADELPDENIIDPIVGGSHNGTSEVYGGSFLAYTFYIRNVGSRRAGYDFYIKIDDMTVSTESNITIDNVIRLRFYKNSVVYGSDGLIHEEDQTHDMVTYAKVRSEPVRTPSSENETRECISRFVKTDDGLLICTGEKEINQGFAEPFYDSEYILKSNEDYIEGKETIRFTVLVWIDGYDLEATGNVPSGAGIQLSMYIALRDEFETEQETASLMSEESGMIVLNENKNFTNIDMKNLTNMNKNFKKEVNDSEEC